MKKQLLIATAASSFLWYLKRSNMKAKRNATPLVGTWQLESAAFTGPDSLNQHDSSSIEQFKMISPERFMFYTKDKNTHALKLAAMGRISVDKNTYTEHVEHSSDENMIGKTYSFTYDVQDDTWRQSGNLGNWKMEEVWRKIN